MLNKIGDYQSGYGQFGIATLSQLVLVQSEQQKPFAGVFEVTIVLERKLPTEPH